MWEFGIIARNLLNGIGFQYPAISVNVPSAYMPPGLPYIYFVIFSFLGDNWGGYVSILILNTIISAFSIFILYRIGYEIYGKTVAVLSAIYAVFSPVYIYSTITFSTIVYYHLFIALCFLFFLKSYYPYYSYKNKKYITNSFKYSILLGITLGLFLYFRAEIFIFVIIVSALFLLSKKIKHAALIFLIPLLLISPWTIRNYIVFGELIPITSTTGYNFFTGHGDDSVAVEYNKILRTFKEDSTFEIKKSELGYQMAFRFIKEKPMDDLLVSLKRVISLWVVDEYRDTAKHPVYLITWLITLFMFLAGFVLSVKDSLVWQKLKFLKVLIIFVTMLVIIFFNIPRYQIQMSFILVPTAMFGLFKIFEFIKLRVTRVK